MNEFTYTCRKCGETHSGMPALAADAPLYFYAIPPEERERRCDLTSDVCIIDEEFFFVRGTIEIPVHGLDEKFNWGAWASLSQSNFEELLLHWEDASRTDLGPYFGWLSAEFLVYSNSENLKTKVHVQQPGIRPLIELEPTQHPLAIEQRYGITQERLAEIYSVYLHPK